eukprot:519089_1
MSQLCKAANKSSLQMVSNSGNARIQCIFLSSSGRVFSAGDNQYGQLGLNTKESDDDHIMRNPTEIKYPNSSNCIDAVANELKCMTQLPGSVVDIILIYLPSFVQMQSIRYY